MDKWQSQLKSLALIVLPILTINTCVAQSTFLKDVMVSEIAADPVSDFAVTREQLAQAIAEWKHENFVRQEFENAQLEAKLDLVHDRMDVTKHITQIVGKVKTTGQLILVNSEGMYFGPNTKGFTQHKDKPLLNEPTSVTDKKKVAATATKNSKVAKNDKDKKDPEDLQANLSQIKLGGGEKFIVDFYGDGLINYAVNEDKKMTKEDAPKNTKITNKNSAYPKEGHIAVSAKRVAHLADDAINMNGIPEAKAAQVHDGEIILSDSEEIPVEKVKQKTDQAKKALFSKNENPFGIKAPRVRLVDPGVLIEEKEMSPDLYAMQQTNLVLEKW